MYERSAIVLEKYFTKMFGIDKTINVKVVYERYKELIMHTEDYQETVIKEDEAIKNFDNVAEKIQKIQKEHEELHNQIQKIIEKRMQIFNNITDDPEILKKELEKIENNYAEKNSRVIEISEEYIQNLAIFLENQKERNIKAKDRRISETKHINLIKQVEEEMSKLVLEDLKTVKEIANNSFDKQEDLIKEKMLKNGKGEKIGFNLNVINCAINERTKIAVEEAKCYIIVSDKMKRIINEINNNSVSIAKYKKILRDVSSKLEFLEYKKEYLVNFLDNERLTIINGENMHAQMMDKACEDFKSDVEQINNLYELLLKEISNKASKKAYNDLYNTTYLIEIENKEKNFEKEANNINMSMGTLINTNYWRIQGIKNIYDIFKKILIERFNKDLSEYDEKEEITRFSIINDNIETEEKIIEKEKNISNETHKYLKFVDEDEFEENDEEEEFEENISNSDLFEIDNIDEEDDQDFESMYEDDIEDEYDYEEELFDEDLEEVENNNNDYYEEEEDDNYDDDEYSDEEYSDEEIEDEEEEDIDENKKQKNKKQGILKNIFKDKKKNK